MNASQEVKRLLELVLFPPEEARQYFLVQVKLELMKLVELVRGLQTSDGTMATLRQFGAALGKDVVVAKDSERLQLLKSFDPMGDADFVDMPLLLKTKGKTTTDHISPAGFWLRFRGHLDRISDNMFTGAVNAFTGERGKTINLLTGERGADVPKVARAYKTAGKRWVVVGDENYGEGSSREHAAMSPRYLGCAAVIARSFARIHESNLKKQGVLPLVFSDPAGYDKVRETDRITLSNLSDLAPGVPVTAILRHEDGTVGMIALRHSLNNEQIAWFRAGSALNLLRRQEGTTDETPAPPPA